MPPDRLHSKLSRHTRRQKKPGSFPAPLGIMYHIQDLARAASEAGENNQSDLVVQQRDILAGLSKLSGEREHSTCVRGSWFSEREENTYNEPDG